MKNLKKFKTALLSVTLLCLAGCSAAPDKSEIEGVIIKYFEAKGYRVIHLKIGDINPVPISKKTYMGKPGYTVDVTSLTIQPLSTKEAPWNDRREETATFRNAQILIQQHSGPSKGWLIAHISGIDVP